MKKIIIIAGLLSVVTLASASSTGLVAVAAYEANFAAGRYGSTQELSTGLAYTNMCGTFDGSIVGNRYTLGKNDSTLGFEIGYSNQVKLPVGVLVGRVGYGRKNDVNYSAGTFNQNLQYYNFGAEYQFLILANITGIAGVRHENAVDSVPYIENRILIGADFALTNKVNARVGITHSTGGNTYNGITTAISYKF
jgi:hypothetical protein